MTPDAAFSQTSAVADAINWIELTLVGNVAIAVATIGVAWFGMMMLSGLFSRRRGIQLIIGCFVIFGASTVASGIKSTLKADTTDAQAAPLEPAVIATAPIAPPGVPAAPYDPYAGAALPPRR